MSIGRSTHLIFLNNYCCNKIETMMNTYLQAFYNRDRQVRNWRQHLAYASCGRTVAALWPGQSRHFRIWINKTIRFILLQLEM